VKICYIDKRFGVASQTIIDQANSIIERYAAAGYTLTLRQLYYQFVASGLIENTKKSYFRIASVVNDSRLAGLIDWNAIEDRTRFVRSLGHWHKPSEMVDACIAQFRIDMWTNQAYRPEVWIEKDALVGVFEPVCNSFDVPLLSCRGYVSQSEMWGAGQRIKSYCHRGQKAVVFHFGDHDPSGMDMTRDIDERLKMFVDDTTDGEWCGVTRVALTMKQIKEVEPPPNPTKLTDVRARGYIAKYGENSWELDALDPTYLTKLVKESVSKLIDLEKWKALEKVILMGRKELRKAAKSLRE